MHQNTLRDQLIREYWNSVHKPFTAPALALTLAFVLLPLNGGIAKDDKGQEKADPAQEIAALGGHLFKSAKTGKVVEMKLNGSAKLSDDDLIARGTALLDSLKSGAT